jgi:hypothetical protein
MQRQVIFRRILLMLNLFALVVIFGLGFNQFVQPHIVKAYYQKRYQVLMFKCDNVMREHLIAKNRMLNEPSDDAVRTLKAAEIGLLECHDYDVMRKHLISLGLTEDDLSQMGLKAIEEDATDVKIFVQEHELKY